MNLTGCENALKACEPVLRERLERAISILESAQTAVNGITGKLFRPTPTNEKACTEKETPSNELEALIEKADRLACRLEADLNRIDSKL